MVEIRGTAQSVYSDVFTAEAIAAIRALAPLDDDRQAVMAARIARRTARATARQRITFLDPATTIPRTTIRVQDARDGAFAGSEIPADLQRQWIQGTGPGAKPDAPIDEEHPQRRVRAAVRRRRLDVRRRGRARPARHDVARQPAQPEAGDSIATPLFLQRRRAGGAAR